MRIAIGQVDYEGNTFCPGTVSVEEFQAWEWCRDAEIIARHRGVRDYLGGMLDAADRLRIEAVPTFSAFANSHGAIAHEACQQLRKELLASLHAAGPVDAICFDMCGAAIAEGVDDLESMLLRDIRELVGPRVPIVVALDLHGNITQEMADYADALLGVKCYPHTDYYDRGVDAVELAHRIVRGEARPAMHLVSLPMMIPPTPTRLSPAKDVNAICEEWETRPGMLDCTFFHGFPYTDTPRVGASIIAIADGDRALARQAAEDVARRLWDMREAFIPDVVTPDESIRMALSTEGRPVVINDFGDNPGGGTPGDATHLLRAMLDAKLTEACFGFIYDPETAEQVHRAGVGSTVEVRLGGKTDELHGTPIEARAYVKCLTDGQFIKQSPMGRGTRMNLEKMARLVIGSVDVIVSSVRDQTFDAEVFLLHGMDVSRYKIVALKSNQHFRAGFEPLAARIIAADSPGLSCANFRIFPYRRLRRPIWPLDLDAALNL